CQACRFGITCASKSWVVVADPMKPQLDSSDPCAQTGDTQTITRSAHALAGRFVASFAFGAPCSRLSNSAMQSTSDAGKMGFKGPFQWLAGLSPVWNERSGLALRAEAGRWRWARAWSRALWNSRVSHRWADLRASRAARKICAC